MIQRFRHDTNNDKMQIYIKYDINNNDYNRNEKNCTI